MDKLTASEALYGFCAWLTTRDEKTIMSASDDAAPIPVLIEKFCKFNGLKEPRSDWHNMLTHPQEKKMKRVFEIEWDEELGPAWMNKWNLETCLNTKEHCGDGLILNVKDVTEEQWLLNTIKKKVLKRMPLAKI
jgi:hypothetical protein